MNQTRKIVLHFIITYLVVLIPLVLVNLWASERTMAQLESATYQSMQSRAKRAAQEIEEMYSAYKGSGAVLLLESKLQGEFWQDNINRYNVTSFIKSVGRQDILVEKTFLYHPAKKAVYSSIGFSGKDAFLNMTLKLDPASTLRMEQVLDEASNATIIALNSQSAPNGYLLFHFPAASMASRSAISVNYLIAFDKLAEKIHGISTGMPVYIRLIFNKDSSVCFYEEEKIEILSHWPQENELQNYVCLKNIIPSMNLDMEIFYHPEELYQPVRSGQKMSLQLLIIGLLFSTLITVWLSSNRIKKLRQLEAVANGASVNFRFHDEYAFIGNLLSNSFHEISVLSSSLKDYGDTIRRQTLQLMLRGAIKDRAMANQLLQSSGMELSEEYFCIGGIFICTEEANWTKLMDKMQEELCCMVDLPKGRMIAFLMELPHQDQNQKIRIRNAKRYQKMLQHMNIPFRICMSQVYQELSMVELAFGEVMDGQEDEREIVCFEELMGNKKPVLQLDSDDLQLFTQSLQEKNLKTALIAFRQMHEKLQAARCTPTNKAYLRYCILQLILASLEEAGEENARWVQWACSIEVTDDEKYADNIQNLLQQTLSPPARQLDIDKITAYIQENYPDPALSAAAVAEFAGINKAHLGRIFKSHFGKTYIEYVSFVRLEKARDLLENTDLTIQEIANQVGYWDHSSFRRKFKNQYEIGVSEYRRQFQDVQE